MRPDFRFERPARLPLSPATSHVEEGEGAGGRVGRRRFEHLHVELSVAVGRLVPRYALWLQLHDLGWNPEELTREAVVEFASEHLERFLADCGLCLSPPKARRLQRELRRFDASRPTPDEVMQRLFVS